MLPVAAARLLRPDAGARELAFGSTAVALTFWTVASVALLSASPYRYDLAKLSHLWNQGSVVRSWLLELAERAFTQDPGLTQLRPYNHLNIRQDLATLAYQAIVD